MANYLEEKFKLKNTQLSKLKPEAKNKTGVTLRKLWKTFKMKNCHMEYFQQRGQNTKAINAFAKNMSTDIKLSKVQF